MHYDYFVSYPTTYLGLSLFLMSLIIIWEVIWKGIGLWWAARNSQPFWFVAILLFNSFGLIPIIYLLFFQPKAAGPTLPDEEGEPKPAAKADTDKKE